MTREQEEIFDKVEEAHKLLAKSSLTLDEYSQIGYHLMQAKRGLIDLSIDGNYEEQ